MSGKRSEYHRAAHEAARQVARSAGAAEQLGLFGAAAEADAERAAAAEADRAHRAGRKPGSRNKAKTGLAEYMAARGYRAPGQHVAMAAGLTEDGDPLEVAFKRAVWLREAAGLPPDPGALASMAFSIWREMNACAAQLLPYTLQKLAPAEPAKPEAERPRLGIAPPSAQLGAAVARAALVPADVRAGFEQNQGLGDGAPGGSDDGGSDDDASD